MPQITVTLSEATYASILRLPKGKKSRFVNAAVTNAIKVICWDRLEFMELFTIGYDEEITRLKNRILDDELQELKDLHAEECRESGYE